MKLIFVFSLQTLYIFISYFASQYFRAYPYKIHKIFYNSHPSRNNHCHNLHFERSEDSYNDVGNHHSILRFAKVMQKSCNDVQNISNNFDPSNLWSQRGFCLIAQNPVIRGLQLEQAAEIIILSSGPNFIWLVVHLDRQF